MPWRIVVWGSTGSLPAPLDQRALRRKLLAALRAARGVPLESDQAIEAFLDSLPFAVRSTYGGNTACVEVLGGEESVILDAGSGLRNLSGALFNRPDALPARFHILLSHLHWDHIQGFPFFAPAFTPSSTVVIYSAHEDTERAFREQCSSPFFPISFDHLAGRVCFVQLDPGLVHHIGGFQVRMIEQDHPGRSYGYRLERGGKTLVYSTDAEHREGIEREDYPFTGFFRDADVLIFDAQYSLVEAIYDKVDWGHASNVAGVELAARAGVKHLCLFHREHTRSDEQLDETLAQTRRYGDVFVAATGLRITLAYDGLEICP
jgi:phosphoribosyl 1,2-cyclic phosphodiesterase